MADRVLDEGTILRVEMEIRLPTAATEPEILRWLRYAVGHSGSISSDNPLIDFEAEAWGTFGVQFSDMRCIGRREEFDHRPGPNAGVSYRVRYHRDPLPRRDPKTASGVPAIPSPQEPRP